MTLQIYIFILKNEELLIPNAYNKNIGRKNKGVVFDNIKDFWICQKKKLRIFGSFALIMAGELDLK
jgi:hypothetical protein